MDTLLSTSMGSIRRCRCVVSVSLCVCDWVCMDAFSWLTLSNQCGCACGSHWGLMHQLAIRWVWHGRGFLLTRILTPISLLCPPPSPRLFWRDPDKISGQQLFQSWLRYVSLSCSIAPFHPFFNSSLITFGAGRPTDSQSCSSICALVRAGVFLKYNSLYLTVSGIELVHISMKLLTGFKSQSGARHIQGYKATHLCYLPPTDISEIMLGLLSNSTRSASGVGN